MAVLQYERGNKPNNVFVTLTTLPTRLKSELHGDLGMKSCIESLLDQSYINKYQIHINIPSVHKHSGEKYILPDWLVDLGLSNQSKLKIFHDMEDIGPATKLVPTVSRLTDPENIIIVVDDDLVYHRDMVAEQVENQKKYENSIVGYDGLRTVEPIFNDTRDYYFTANYTTSKVDILQHYKSVSYKRKYFEDDFFDFINENLTFYRKTVSNVSSRFNKFSKNWWKRRMQAHQFFQKFSKDNKLNFYKNFDFLLTKFICKFL